MISISIDLVSPHALLFGDGMWTKYTVDYTQLASGFSNFDLTFASLPAKRMLLAVCIKHSTSFSGGALTAYTLQVGLSGNTNKYASAFDVLQAPGSSIAQVSTGGWCEDFASSTTVRVRATATGGATNAATQGTADIWLYTTDLP